MRESPMMNVDGDSKCLGLTFQDELMGLPPRALLCAHQISPVMLSPSVSSALGSNYGEECLELRLKTNPTFGARVNSVPVRTSPLLRQVVCTQNQLLPLLSSVLPSQIPLKPLPSPSYSSTRCNQVHDRNRSC
jgi:hypothetical protein